MFTQRSVLALTICAALLLPTPSVSLLSVDAAQNEGRRARPRHAQWERTTRSGQENGSLIFYESATNQYLRISLSEGKHLKAFRRFQTSGSRPEERLASSVKLTATSTSLRFSTLTLILPVAKVERTPLPGATCSTSRFRESPWHNQERQGVCLL